MRLPLGALVELLGPALLVVVVGLVTTTASASNKIYFLNALVSVAIVVAIYVFVGISGVLSFGQISFVAVGAFAAGVMTVPVISKKGVLTSIFPLLRDHSVGNVTSLLLAAALGGVFAFVVGIPLMRLSGLAAGIATFAVLEITHNVLREWTKIGPGATTLALVPETTGALQATVGALVAIAVAFFYQRSRRGRLLRASREDPAVARSVGVNIHLERLLAFTVSGALGGLRRRPLRPSAGLDHDRAGLPRADVPDARDARRSAVSRAFGEPWWARSQSAGSTHSSARPNPASISASSSRCLRERGSFFSRRSWLWC